MVSLFFYHQNNKSSNETLKIEQKEDTYGTYSYLCNRYCLSETYTKDKVRES